MQGVRKDFLLGLESGMYLLIGSFYFGSWKVIIISLYVAKRCKHVFPCWSLLLSLQGFGSPLLQLKLRQSTEEEHVVA